MNEPTMETCWGYGRGGCGSLFWPTDMLITDEYQFCLSCAQAEGITSKESRKEKAMLNIDIAATLPDGRVIATLTQQERVEEWFTYHAPNAEQQVAYQALRDKAKELALLILAHVPGCADQSAAMRHLRECIMTANAGIATHGV